MGDNFVPVLSAAARDHQFVVVSDTDHREGALLQFMARPEHMQALAAQGVKHFFLEQEETLSPSFQQYQDGSITREQMRASMNVYAPRIVGGMTAQALTAQQRDSRIQGMMDLLDNAKANGIRVHCVYNEAGTRELRDMLDSVQSIGQQILADMRNSAGDVSQKLKVSQLTRAEEQGNQGEVLHLTTEWLNQQPQSYRDAIAARYRAEVVPGKAAFGKARVDADAEIAQRMIALAGTDKAVAFYGAGHGMHADDLDDHLPSSTRLLLGADAQYAVYLRPPQQLLMDPARQPDPHSALGMYLLKEGKFIEGTPQGIGEFCASGSVDMSRLSLCSEPEAAAPAAAKPVAPTRGVSGP